MTGPSRAELSELERELQKAFTPPTVKGFTSTAGEAPEEDYIKQLVLPLSSRGKVPLTRESFVVEENPAKVEWERHVREFLAHLNKDFGHRVTAPMIYEWTTGISIKELAAREGADQGTSRGGGQNGSANVHLRHINSILREYFGKPYKTKIMGRPVGQAYTVRPNWSVRKKKPVCLTLWPEWDNGTLAY